MTLSPRPRAWHIAALVLALSAAGCDQPSPSSPESGRQAALDASYSSYRILTDTTSESVAAPSEVAGTFGSEGGSLTVGGHTLTIPAGALLERIRFTMATVPGSIQVSLHAYSETTGAPVVAFPSPLQLSLSYGGAKVGNPNRLAIAWVVSGQVVMVQPSSVDKSERTVTSWLYHFTDYAAVLN